MLNAYPFRPFKPATCRLLALWLLVMASPLQAQYNYSLQLGAEALGVAQFRYPSWVTTDGQGDVYVTGLEDARVHKHFCRRNALVQVQTPSGGHTLRFVKR